jgi:hypothetical protein
VEATSFGPRWTKVLQRSLRVPIQLEARRPSQHPSRAHMMSMTLRSNVATNRMSSLFAVGAVLSTFIQACASSSASPLTDALGAPCSPQEEYRPEFAGFNYSEVTLESRNAQCKASVCLVNHFQGRVTCPYGQAKDGSPIQGAAPQCNVQNPLSGSLAGCCTPGVPQPVTGPLVNGMPLDPRIGQTVPGQCINRTANRAVYCSCRCANVQGGTNDGASYCACPNGYSCTPLGGTDGAYCIKQGTEFDPNQACAACDPSIGGCGKAQGVGG